MYYFEYATKVNIPITSYAMKPENQNWYRAIVTDTCSGLRRIHILNGLYMIGCFVSRKCVHMKSVS